MSFEEYQVKNVIGVPEYSVVKFSEKKSRVALVIPVLNEGSRIINQIKKIESTNFDVDIIIADGCSTDGSLEYFRRNLKNVVAVLVKQGEGKLSAQLRMAFDFCMSSGYDAVITMDGNNKDGVQGIEAIRASLLEGNDFVQGSRFIKGGNHENTPLSRYLAIRLIHAPLTSIAAHHWYTDTTNGFRGHSSHLLKDARIGVFRDCFESYELIAFLPIAAGRLRFKIREVPVSRVYPKNQPIPTKIIGIKSYFDLLMILFRSGSGRYFVK